MSYALLGSSPQGRHFFSQHRMEKSYMNKLLALLLTSFFAVSSFAATPAAPAAAASGAKAEAKAEKKDAKADKKAEKKAEKKEEAKK